MPLAPIPRPTLRTATTPRRRWRALAAAAGLALLAGCGGGDDDGFHGGDGLTCSVADQKTWLRGYMADWYFWKDFAASPDPAGYGDVASYFEALLYTGTDPHFPADRWSGFESTESFNRYFGDGRTLGYGVAVNGVEAVATPGLTPLRIRYVEPLSPAAAAGLVRGDTIVSLNGRAAADIVAADDFGVLSPADVGDTLTLVLRSAGGAERTVTLSAAIFDLTPVRNTQVLATPGGRRVGYVFVNQMISQAESPLANAFATLRNGAVQDLVLDLRYNGGGLVSTSANLASLAAGPALAGQTYAQLLYNDRHAGSNQVIPFVNLANALSMPRVYVLAGPRTCSASEQLINGLEGVGITVVSVGDTTCGKPVGFLPEGNCGTTYSVVNFESANARFEGRYFDGFEATCAVAENLSLPIGDTSDPLLVAAAAHVDTGACPAGTGRFERPAAVKRKPGARTTEPGERQGMTLGR